MSFMKKCLDIDSIQISKKIKVYENLPWLLMKKKLNLSKMP